MAAGAVGSRAGRGGRDRGWMAERQKRVIATLLIVAAVAYLIATNTGATATFFLTVDELAAMGEGAHGRRLTVSGAVLGDTIVDEPALPRVRFDLVHVPGDSQQAQQAGGLAAAISVAMSDPDARRLSVVYEGARPGLLQHGAQAVVRGTLGEDGVFHADEVLLKCPARYSAELSAPATPR